MATTTNQPAAETQSIRLKRFQDVKSSYVGAEGTPERHTYEAELRAEVIAEKIKELRKARHMTQQELGDKIGVKKAQVSRLESSTANITLDTLQKVFLALGARVTFGIEPLGE
ncbi:XRE family transcriptional regulator [Hymenobacter aquaticus]|uniref:XRE family transcriptional regulator n=1 Tax=Hymenobacter aquaticus TaxID=1867101 RepID=A0A4Z0Q2K7_9BACT|nr:helix-turn-helix transcriptional regulator [Hymenobacter aquaticus]TGE24257.1 XRE family transcriptional regulator [Hymenobacter aquaticus]